MLVQNLIGRILATDAIVIVFTSALVVPRQCNPCTLVVETDPNTDFAIDNVCPSSLGSQSIC